MFTDEKKLLYKGNLNKIIIHYLFNFKILIVKFFVQNLSYVYNKIITSQS